jgi:hypothetical protein
VTIEKYDIPEKDGQLGEREEYTKRVETYQTSTCRVTCNNYRATNG